jgi:D-beta-D-heptose 7-phosphate kinase/D-beta-D-heptose 1-phosphate adenosyltransferase
MVSPELTELLCQSRRPRVLVVGDVMLDRYVWGDVDRISPEAPIPVLKVAKREERLGGAGSVVTLLSALEADALLATITADDQEARTIRRLLDQLQVTTDGVLTDVGRSTTVKERFLGRTQSRHPQQMIRVDREDDHPISDELADQLLGSVRRHLGEVEVVLVSDYNKGVCKGRLVADVTSLARQSGVPVIADPVRGADYHRYRGCTCITPNRTEAGLALGRKIRAPEEGLEAAGELLRFDVESAVVTLDRDGIAWADARGRSRLFPARPRQVYDITGAGDMVLAAIAYGLASGADWPTAIELANLAGGLEVERLGVAPLARRELLAEWLHGPLANSHKILTLSQLRGELRQRRAAGGRIVMTNGCFDLLHPGHVASLQYARNHGDCLVVGLNSDPSMARLKGGGRPIIDQQGRAQMLAALACVDYVVIFDDASVAGLVEQVAPDVLVKSDQYAPDEVVGHEIVERSGGRIVLAPMQGAYSTTGLIERIRRLADHGVPPDHPEGPYDS